MEDTKPPISLTNATAVLVAELRSTLSPHHLEKLNRLISLKDQETQERELKILEMEASSRKKDRAMDALKACVGRLEDEAVAWQYRVQRAEEMAGKFSEECAKAEEEIKELKMEKMKLSKDMVSWRNKFRTLAPRVSVLEHQLDEIIKLKAAALAERESIGGPDVIKIDSDDETSQQKCTSDLGDCDSDGDNLPICTLMRQREPMQQQPSSLLCGTGAAKANPVSRHPIYVGRSEEDNRRGAYSVICDCNSDGDNLPTGTLTSQREPLQQPASDWHGTGAAKATPVYQHPDFVGECEIDNVDSVIDSIVADLLRKKTKAWPYKTDMIEAFKREPELCMKAVCALYKEQVKAKSGSGIQSSYNQGFNHFDTLRATALAKFLTDGDPECRLRKSVLELQLHDPKGLEDCKRLAIRYSDELWDYVCFRG